MYVVYLGSRGTMSSYIVTCYIDMLPEVNITLATTAASTSTLNQLNVYNQTCLSDCNMEAMVLIGSSGTFYFLIIGRHIYGVARGYACTRSSIQHTCNNMHQWVQDTCK